MIPDKFKVVLEEVGAMDLTHSGKSLYDHLYQTYQLLLSWGNPDDVCIGGLFHSIYSTQAYTQQAVPFEEREKVIEAIGKEAEQLAYLFCECDRNSFYGTPGEDGLIPYQSRRNHQVLLVDEEIQRALLEIESANIVEQHPRIKDRTDASRAIPIFSRLLDFNHLLTTGAVSGLKQCIQDFE